MSASLLVIPIVLFLEFYFSGYALHQSVLHRVKLENQKQNLMGKLNQFSTLELQEFTNAQTIYDYRDYQYYIQVTIGSNYQTFLVLLDTGSRVFWVPDQSCKSTICTSKKRFFQDASHSYYPTNQIFRTKYGIGQAQGFYGIDTVGFGIPPVFTVPDCYVGQATLIEQFALPGFNGICGLGPVDYDGVDSPILQAFKQGILPKPMFSIYLEKDGINANGSPAGVVTWGEIDTVNCCSHVDYVPLLPVDGHWTFNIRGICYGGYCNNQIKKAFTDTGASMIHGPYKAVFEIWAKMGVNKSDRTLPCNADIKPLELKIGRKVYKLPKDLIIREYQPGSCMSLLSPETFITDYWILGDPFIHQYCQIHDFGNRRIGFSRSKRTEI